MSRSISAILSVIYDIRLSANINSGIGVRGYLKLSASGDPVFSEGIHNTRDFIYFLFDRITFKCVKNMITFDTGVNNMIIIDTDVKIIISFDAMWSLICRGKNVVLMSTPMMDRHTHIKASTCKDYEHILHRPAKNVILGKKNILHSLSSFLS